MKKSWVALAAGLLLAAAAGSAAAQEQPEADPDAEARELFERGRDALGRGHYEVALASFRAAYDLSGRPELLFNIGVAADRLRHDDEAIAAFEAYVRERPQAANRGEVEARLRVLRRQRAGAEPEPEPEPDREPEPAPGPTDPVAPVDEGSGVTGQWWFWAGVVLVVAAATVTVLIVTARDVPEDPLPGSLGGAVATLRW